MKDIIKKVLIGVLVVAIIGGVAYKFVFSSPDTTDPYGSTNGVIDGNGQPVTDANGVTLNAGNNADPYGTTAPAGQTVNGTTAPAQQTNPVQQQSTTNGGYITTAPQQQGGNSTATTRPTTQYQGGSVDNTPSGGNKIDAYQEIFKSGKFMMKINDPDLGPVTMAMSGNKMFIDASMEGLSLKMIYDGDKKDEDNPELGTWYIVIDSIKKYSPLPADMIGDMNVEELTKDFANSDSDTVYTSSVEDVNGELLDVESCVDSNGNTTKYYFRGSELVRSDSISPDGSVSTTEFQLVTGDVADSVFEIPSGYAKWNISWLINMLG